MGDSLLEIIGGLVLMILGGLGFYTKRAHTRIDDVNASLDKSIADLDKRKANHEDVKEMKDDIKKILREIKSFEVENARWQGQMEGRELNKPDRY